MKNSIVFNVKSFRAIQKANVQLDGITVLCGENGAGKSTLSRLLYHILEYSINFERYTERPYRLWLINSISFFRNVLMDFAFRGITSKSSMETLQGKASDFRQE